MIGINILINMKKRFHLENRLLSQITSMKMLHIGKLRHGKILSSHWNSLHCATKKMIEGYLHYLRLLLNIKEFSKINLNNCKSLPNFLENLKSLVKQDFGFDEYNALKSCNEYYYRQFFRKQGLYCWIGLYLPEGNIYIGFKDSSDWINLKLPYNLNNTTDFCLIYYFFFV